MHFDMKNQVYTHCRSDVFRTLEFCNIWPKLVCMAESVGIYRVFCCQASSVGCISDTTWLVPGVKWVDTCIQGIFSSQSCLHRLCTSISPVNQAKLNLDSSNLLQSWLEWFPLIVSSIHGDLPVGLVSNITGLTTNLKILQTRMQHNFWQESVK